MKQAFIIITLTVTLLSCRKQPTSTKPGDESTTTGNEYIKRK